MTHVLLMSAQFPPTDSGGVRRVAAFARELSVLGYQVTTLAGGGAPTIRYRSLADGFRDAARSVKLGRVWRKANELLALPDAKIVDLPAIVARAIPRPDVIIASSPPASVLIAGALLARRFDCPLIADLRDQWSDHPRLVAPSALHRGLQRLLEQGTLSRASAILAATDGIQHRLQERVRAPVHAIYNGYDPEPFRDRPSVHADSVGFFGSIYDPLDPEPLVHAVKAAGRTLEHAGHDYDRRLARAVEQHQASFADLGQLTGAQVARRMMGTGVLTLILPDDPAWSAVRTQKLAEYLASGRPILAMVREGEAAALLNRYDAGVAVAPGDWQGAAAAIPLLLARASRALGPAELTWSAQAGAVARVVESC